MRFILLGCVCDYEPVTWQKVFNNITARKGFSENYVDLILEQDFFDNLKITCGPCTTEAEKTIVQAIVSEFDKNKKIEVLESKISMK